MPFPEHTLALTCHPETPAPAVRAVEVRISRRPEGGLALAYRLAADMARLRIPVTQPAGPADGLWQHSCFEVFIGVTGAPAYREFNFSPSGQWAAYAFSAYRRRDEAATPAMPAPRIAARPYSDRLELDALIAAPALPPGAALRCGLSAVIEAVDGSRSYWALHHPPGRPDFHHPDAFALELAEPGAGA